MSASYSLDQILEYSKSVQEARQIFQRASDPSVTDEQFEKSAWTFIIGGKIIEESFASLGLEDLMSDESDSKASSNDQKLDSIPDRNDDTNKQYFKNQLQSIVQRLQKNPKISKVQQLEIQRFKKLLTRC